MKIKYNQQKLKQILVHWSILLSCFSYPITASAISYFNLPNTIVNIGLKIIFVILNLILIFITSRKLAAYPRIVQLVLIFFSIYSIRVLVDTLIFDIQFAGGDKFYVYSYFFGATFIPIIAIISGRKHFDYHKLIRQIHNIIFVANIAVLFALSISKTGLTEEILNTRATVYIINDAGVRGSLINPIMISYFGGVLFSLSLSWLLLYNLDSWKIRLYYIIGLGVGIYTLIIGASRGPFIFTALLSFITIGYFLYNQKKDFKYIWKILLLGIIVFFITNEYIIPLLGTKDLFIITRLTEFKANQASGKEEYRDLAFASAWQDFLDNPVFGKQFVGTFDNFYPHNVYLEILMATGLVGGFFFALITFQYLKQIFKILFSNGEPIQYQYLIIFIIPFFLSLTSGSLFAGGDSWILLTLFLLIPYHLKTL